MGSEDHMEAGGRKSSVTERELITAINQVEMLGTSMRGLAEQIREMRDEMREDRKGNAKSEDLEDLTERMEKIETRQGDMETKLSASGRDLFWMTTIGGGVIGTVVWVLQRFAA